MTTTPTLRIVVAINPQASFGKSRAVGPLVVRAMRDAGHDVTSLSEQNMAELEAATKNALATAPDALVVVGGDGMVHFGTNLVAGTGIPLGIVPAGTGNDMSRGLRIPVGDPGAAIAALLEALARPARAIDAGIVTHADGSTTWFACVLSAGFDAIVNERANRMRWPRGRQRYNLAILRELAVLKPIRYRLELDGEPSETEAVLVAVANNTSFGGGMLVTPDAVLDDGLFDVLVVQPLARTAFLRIFPRVFKGTHVTDARVSIRRASRVRIDAQGIVAYADGERQSALPLEITIAPAALLVLAPAPVAPALPRPTDDPLAAEVY